MTFLFLCDLITHVNRTKQNERRNKILPVIGYVILVDLTLGFLRGIKEHKVNSTIGLSGIATHSAIFGICYFGLMLANFYHVQAIATDLVCVIILGNYGVSILANCKLLGIWLPPKLEKFLQSEINRKANKFNDL